MNRQYKIFLAVALYTFISATLINGCKKASVRKPPGTPLNFTVPDGFPEPVYDFSSNPPTEEGFQLGKKLFHDNRLSKFSDVTCSSCHQQHSAYTTFDHDLGHGTNRQHTTRTVPVIFNMVWHSEFQWDGSVNSLDEQPFACMMAPEKMGEDVNSVVEKLKEDAEYRELFSKAFGDETVTGERMQKALVQFVAMLVSSNSRYDLMKKGQATFNASEQNGYAIFQSKCASCHVEPLFTDFTYRNNGLALNPTHNDFGRMRVTGNPADSLKFKVPTLRNIALTGYFAHDGRYPSFTQMIDHYSSEIQKGPTLDVSLQNDIPLTDLEKFYLQEFLFTLTDSVLVTDTRFE